MDKPRVMVLEQQLDCFAAPVLGCSVQCSAAGPGLTVVHTRPVVNQLLQPCTVAVCRGLHQHCISLVGFKLHFFRQSVTPVRQSVSHFCFSFFF